VRKQFTDTAATSITWGDLLWKTETCDVIRAKVHGIETIVKRLMKPADPNSVIRIKEEIVRVQKPHHPHVMPVVGGCFDPNCLCVLSEAQSAIPLQLHIHDFEIEFDSNQVLQWALQIAQALEALHQSNLTHLNLKSRNVMVRPPLFGAHISLLKSLWQVVMFK
jgi:serine/threonine protein kinase